MYKIDEPSLVLEGMRDENLFQSLNSALSSFIKGLWNDGTESSHVNFRNWLAWLTPTLKFHGFHYLNYMKNEMTWLCYDCCSCTKYYNYTRDPEELIWLWIHSRTENLRGFSMVPAVGSLTLSFGTQQLQIMPPLQRSMGLLPWRTQETLSPHPNIVPPCQQFCGITNQILNHSKSDQKLEFCLEYFKL